MARITVEDCLSEVANRFELVMLVAKRAKQLAKGSECTVAGRGNKFVVSALREVAAKNVAFDYVGDGTPESQVVADLNR